MLDKGSTSVKQLSLVQSGTKVQYRLGRDSDAFYLDLQDGSAYIQWHSPKISGPGFLSTSPESRISSISAFIADCREVVATKHSDEKMRSLRRTGTRKQEEEEEEEEDE